MATCGNRFLRLASAAVFIGASLVPATMVRGQSVSCVIRKDSTGADIADSPVIAMPGTRPPAYPPALRAARIDGKVLAQFVVDTAGVVERGSVTIKQSPHGQFSQAVRLALESARFTPAKACGVPIRYTVTETFVFTIRR